MERPVLEGPFLVDFQSRLRARALGQIAGLLISGPGILRFSLSDETQELVKWDVTVTKLGEGTFSIAWSLRQHNRHRCHKTRCSLLSASSKLDQITARMRRQAIQHRRYIEGLVKKFDPNARIVGAASHFDGRLLALIGR